MAKKKIKTRKNERSKRLVKIDLLDRLKDLDELLQSPWGYTRYELIDILGIKLSTIKTYIQDVKGGKYWSKFVQNKYPDYYSGKLNILSEEKVDSTGVLKYKYSVKGFSMFDEQLTEDVIQSLMPFLEHINQIYGLDDILTEVIKSMSDVLKSQRNGKYKEQIERIENATLKTIKISLQETFNLTAGFEDSNMFTFRNAIINKEALLIEYKPFDKPISTLTCHPYLIVESASRWYLICHIEDVIEEESGFQKRLNRINNLPMERMHNVKVLEEAEYIEAKVKVIEDCLEHAVGPSIPNWENPERMNIKLKLSDRLTNYFKTKPFLYRGETIKGNIFSYKNAIYTIEMRSRILRYGSEIEVIEPKELRKKITDELKELNKVYKIFIKKNNNLQFD